MARLRKHKAFAGLAAVAAMALFAFAACQQDLALKSELVKKVELATIKHSFSVEAGLGGSASASGESSSLLNVPIAISAAPTAYGGFLFANWSIVSGSATLADEYSAETSLTILGDGVVVRANFTVPTNRNWNSIASDSSGKYLAAVPYGGNVYTSSDCGATWTLCGGSPSLTWNGIASDSSGRLLAAVAFGGTIYTSSDYGVTWAARSSGLPASAQWHAICSDSSGQMLAAAAGTGTIYTSSDFGVSWTARTTSNGLPSNSESWFAIAGNATGQNLIAATTGTSGKLYYSEDAGGSWSQLSGDFPSTASWTCVANSSTSTELRYAFAVSGGDLYTLIHNAGSMGWTPNDYAPTATTYWMSIAANSAGSSLLAAASGSYLFWSDSTGSAWTQIGSSAQWNCVASDGTGYYLAAGVYGGHIYVSSDQGATWKQSL